MDIQEQELSWAKAEELVRVFDSRQKYVSDYENRDTMNEGVNILYSKKQIKFKVYSMIQLKQSYYDFITSLTKALLVKREGKAHNILCEYATGTNCSCWCNEKYHGLKGST